MVKPISRRFAEDAILIRQSAGARNGDGVFVSGAEEQIAIRVATAPVPSKSGVAEMRDVLPEGSRHSERRIFWVNMPLDALRRGAAVSDSDYIEYGGRVFRVQGVSVWETNGLTQVDAVLPDEGEVGVPPGADSFAAAPVIYPVEIVDGHPHVLPLEIPDGEVTTIDTLLTRAQVSSYHTLAMYALFPVFTQLISVPYLLTHDGLDIAVGYFHFEHTVGIQMQLQDTLVLTFDLTRSGEGITNFQIRGIG